MRIFVAVEPDEETRREIEKLLKVLTKKHWAVRWEEVNKLHITMAFLGDLRTTDELREKIQNLKFKSQSANWRIKLKIKKIKECVKLTLKQAKETHRPIGVKELASEESIKPFSLFFKGLGCFPDYDWPRIVWLGLKGDLKSLAALQKRIEENLLKAGFDFKRKPFHPHITLGRIKKTRAAQRREIGRQIKALREIRFKNQWLVDRVVVYQSRCLPEGSVYNKLQEVPLLVK